MLLDSEENFLPGLVETGGENPPDYYSTYYTNGKGLTTSAYLTKDGRIDISFDLRDMKKLPDLPEDWANPVREFDVDPKLAAGKTSLDGADKNGFGGRVPVLNIVVMIVGSRGDVQPYVAFALELANHGHRVRLATHGTFREFVLDVVKQSGYPNLEFFDIGGDPHELMSYMVRNPGLMPGITSLTNGDIPKKRKTMKDILMGCWRSCISPNPENGQPFVADAIIANPPSFAHIHIAEALGIPLLLSFTMPWCPTTAFPHPLVNVSESNAEIRVTNYLSYALAEIMTWKGLGDIINKFRKNTLGLEAMTSKSGPGVIDRLKVPWTYCFSGDLVPKPKDWQNHIDVVGFYFLDLAKNYQPAPDLEKFLEAGPPPIYIGFGSIVVEDPEALTEMIFEATRLAGVRALVSAGWGGLGTSSDIPSHIFILGNVPHDWLFTKVSAVVHHGGAGTTAIGLRLGKPTVIVPFFGDQPFWGSMVWKARAGPKPISKEKLSVERLREGIEFCLTEEARKNAMMLGESIMDQNGVAEGVKSFHRHLPLLNMRCDILSDRLAIWWDNEHCLRLSTLAAQVLNEEGLISLTKLDLHRPKEYDTYSPAKDPISGGVVELFRALTNASASLAQIFYSPVKGLVNTTFALPRGMVNLVASFYEGLHHTPSLYGGKIRNPGKVTDLKSGLLAGGKDICYGLYDGVSALWNEPAEGLKKEGSLGLLKGAGRGFGDMAFKPTAGAMGLLVNPMRGAWLSIRKLASKVTFEKDIRSIRIDVGIQETQKLPPSQAHVRKTIIDVFKEEAKKHNVKARRARIAEQMKSYIQEGGAGGVVQEPPKDTERSPSPEGSASPRALTKRRVPPRFSPRLPTQPDFDLGYKPGPPSTGLSSAGPSFAGSSHPGHDHAWSPHSSRSFRNDSMYNTQPVSPYSTSSPSQTGRSPHSQTTVSSAIVPHDQRAAVDWGSPPDYYSEYHEQSYDRNDGRWNAHDESLFEQQIKMAIDMSIEEQKGQWSKSSPPH